jgi:hypothetical protein
MLEASLFRRGLPFAAAIASACALAAPARAAEPFQVNVTVGTTNGTASGSIDYENLTSTISSLNTTNLQQIVSAYTSNSAVTATINLRGLTTVSSFGVNSTTLNFAVPSLGISQTFSGATREDSGKLLLTYLEKYASQILTALAAHSYIDPVAGNPASLSSRMISADFMDATGFGGFSDDQSPTGRTADGKFEIVPNAVTTGTNIDVGSSAGHGFTNVTLPINYTVFFADPRYSLTIDLPLTYTTVQGAQGGEGSLGISMRVPVLENWYLTGSLRAGLAGSLDLGSAGVAYTGAVTSLYNLYFGGTKVAIGNGVGVLKTSPISIGKFSVGPNLTNYPIINGASVERDLDFTLFDKPTTWEAYVIDTYLPGDKLAINHYDEIGATFGTRRQIGDQSWNVFRLGVSYTHGKSFDMVSLRGTYRF